MPPATGLLPRERRRKSRVSTHVPITVTYSGPRDEITQDGICTDLSESGIAFETPADLFVGEIVDVTFRQKGAEAVRVSVRLLYKAGNRYGSYFMSPDS
jgi:PilZ domain